MAYDERLAGRIRRVLAARTDVTERRMFGGLAFLCGGRMCCGIVGRDLMVRIPEAEFDDVMRDRHARPMDFTGRPLRGFAYVAPDGFRTAASLRAWVSRGERVAAAHVSAAGAPAASNGPRSRQRSVSRRKRPT